MCNDFLLLHFALCKTTEIVRYYISFRFTWKIARRAPSNIGYSQFAKATIFLSKALLFTRIYQSISAVHESSKLVSALLKILNFQNIIVRLLNIQGGPWEEMANNTRWGSVSAKRKLRDADKNKTILVCHS